MDLMVHFYSKAFLKRFTHILVLILLFACDGQTPEEYDQAFEIEFNACMSRATLKCENPDTDVCIQQAISRCETFLGTKENPVVK